MAKALTLREETENLIVRTIRGEPSLIGLCHDPSRAYVRDKLAGFCCLEFDCKPHRLLDIDWDRIIDTVKAWEAGGSSD